MTDHPDDSAASQNVFGRLLTRLMLNDVLVVVLGAGAAPPPQTVK
jgi:hypothetical protein